VLAEDRESAFGVDKGGFLPLSEPARSPTVPARGGQHRRRRPLRDRTPSRSNFGAAMPRRSARLSRWPTPPAVPPIDGADLRL